MRKRWSSARPRARVLMIVGLALVVAAASTGSWWFFGRSSATAAASTSTTTTVQASTTTIQKSVSETGTLTPSVQEDVSFAVSGTVTAVSVAAGATVTAGQTLATVSTLQLNASLLAAKATLATAQAKLTSLQDAADGSDSSNAQIAAQEAQITVAEAAVTTAKANLADATLTSPVAGLVTAVNISVGDSISGAGANSASNMAGTTTTTSSGSSGSSSSSSAQFVIVGTTAYQSTVSVGTADLAKIAVGNQVEMTSTDLTGTVYGTVSSIGLVSTTTSGTAGYPVVITVTGDTSALHDGVSVTALLIYSRRTDVLTIPTAAITKENGTSYVNKVGTDGTVTKTAVVTGDVSGTLTEITSGLAAGDSVQVVTYTRSASSGRSTSGTSQNNQQQGGYSGSFPGGSGNFPGGGNGSGTMPQGGPGGGN